MFRRTVWGLGDQAVSSLSSLLLAVMVARESTALELGAWAISYAVYTFFLAVVRAAVSTTALISQPSVKEEWTDKGAISASFVIGVVAAIPLLAVGLIIGGTLGSYLLVFGAGLPVLLLQDAMRYFYIRIHRPSTTTLLDMTWLSIQLAAGICASIVTGSGILICLAWLGGALTSSVIGMILIRMRLSLALACRFLNRNLASASKLLGDSLISAGAAHLVPVFLGLIIGLQGTGAFRGGLTLVGVAGVVVMGLTPIATVEVMRRIDDPASRRGFLTIWSLGIAAIGLSLVVLLTAIGDVIGEALIGSTWNDTESIIIAMAIQVLFRGPVTGVPILLRAANLLTSVLKIRAITSLTTIAITVGCAAFFGVSGAAWGWAASSVVGGAISVIAYWPRLWNSSNG